MAEFCHYAELVGATVYPSYAANVSLNSADILENLSKYRVGEIDHFYQDLQNGMSLDNTKLNFKHLFGYDSIKLGQGADTLIDNSLTNITAVLQAIAEFYNFWKGSYSLFCSAPIEFLIVSGFGYCQVISYWRIPAIRSSKSVITI